MRLFIAVNINRRSKSLIGKKFKILKEKINCDCKWVEKEKWHLTLKFIGKASAKDKENLIKVLKNFNFNQQNQYIQFNRIDAFPNSKQAKVIYFAVDEGKDVLKSLHHRLEKELLKYGFKNDQREFIPHLTVGRSNNGNIKLSGDLTKKNFVNIYARIKSISLYESKLKVDGPEYIELFSIK